MAYFQGTCVGSYGYIYDGIKHISPRSPYTNSKTLFKGQVTKFIQPIDRRNYIHIDSRGNIFKGSLSTDIYFLCQGFIQAMFGILMWIMRMKNQFRALLLMCLDCFFVRLSSSFEKIDIPPYANSIIFFVEFQLKRRFIKLGWHHKTLPMKGVT